MYLYGHIMCAQLPRVITAAVFTADSAWHVTWLVTRDSSVPAVAAVMRANCAHARAALARLSRTSNPITGAHFITHRPRNAAKHPSIHSRLLRIDEASDPR